MHDYLKIILPVLAALITAIWGIIRYFKDRRLDAYTEKVNDLYSKDKAKVLSTIATLDFFKNNRRYKANVIDILINRFYTELDYEIVNAIITELSQVGSVREFRYVSTKFLDINRNFVVQREQIEKRYEVLKLQKEKITADYLLLEDEDELREEMAKLVLESEANVRKYETLSNYQLKWHSQVVGEAFAMLLLEANRKKITAELEVTLFENDLSGTHLFNFVLRKLSILYAAFEQASLQELKLMHIDFVHAYFENTLIRRTVFNGGVISNVEFVNVQFDWVTFKNIKFEEVYFIGVAFNKCTFDHVSGLDEKLFYNCTWLNRGDWIDTSFNPDKTNNTKKSLETYLKNSNRSMWGRDFIQRKLNEQVKKKKAKTKKKKAKAKA